MIDLSSIRKLVTHDGCADGIASSLIIRNAIPDVAIEWVQYGTHAYLSLKAEPGLLFCDMTPPPERVQEFVDAGSIVLDHHRGARDLVAKFGDRGVFADEEAEPGVSGALLAFREVWSANGGQVRGMGSVVKQFATLAGVRDTWSRQSPDWREACAQAAALRFWPRDALVGLDLFTVLDTKMDIGEVLLQRDEERDARSIREAYRTTIDGVRVAMFEGLHTSDIADALASEVDLVMGWHYLCEGARLRMVVSCRSRNDFSAMDFAKHWGGGGHRQAAGFTIDAREWAPYESLSRLLCAYLQERRLAA